MMNSIVYVHGGPGFNSNPEKYLLGEALGSDGQEVHYWNEPSRLRGTAIDAATLQACTASFESLLLDCYSRTGLGSIVIAHSFGIQTVLAALPIASKLISQLVAISPAIDLKSLDKNILAFAKKDLETLAGATVAQSNAAADLSVLMQSLFLQEAYEKSPGFKQAMSLALQDPILLTHYWKNAEAMNRYFSFFSEAQFGFDFDNFLSVRASLASLQKIQTNIDTLVIFGAEDLVTPRDQQLVATLQVLNNSQLETMEGCSHYPHVESPLLFKSIFQEFISKSHLKSPLLGSGLEQNFKNDLVKKSLSTYHNDV